MAFTQPAAPNFAAIDEAQAALDAYRPFPAHVMHRLNQRLRLDWNFHSNALEGNSLTYGETKALILHDRYIGNKEGRHYREMATHNDVLKTLEELVAQDTPISEKLIKELHSQMLREPYYNRALTPDGLETQKKIVPGAYKTTPNSVLRSTGEMFYYVEPSAVSACMHELIKGLGGYQATGVHPVAMAAWFHYEFIRIHPFDDGNGRLGRILMNLLLQRAGYPPAIVRVEDKGAYLNSLVLADATEDLTVLTQLVANRVADTLALTLRAAKGEPLD